MSLPLTHAGGSVDGISAALDLRFASSLSLTSTSGITPSFSRASTGTFFNSSGVLTTAAINAPRFDHVYDGTSWVSKGLLVEEQRTNLATYSEDFSNAAYGISGVTVLANQVAAPDGNTTADKLTMTSSGTFYQSPFYGSAGAQAGSVWLRADSTQTVMLRIANDSGGESTTSTVTVTTSWQRFSVVRTFAANPIKIWFGIDQRSILGGPNVAATIYGWGYQIETGSFPTSYIPTTTAAVTRSADVCQITGGDFSGFWNQTEGSVVLLYDMLLTTLPAGSNQRVFTAWNAGFSSGLVIGDDSSGCYVEVNPGAGFTFGSSVSPTNVALGYKVNDFATGRNGGAVLTDTSGAGPSGLTTLNIGNNIGNGTSSHNGHIARLRYFNKRLTNSQLEDLCKPEQQLKLDLNFSSSLSLTPTVGPTPSFSRASTGTYFNASGVLTTAAINGPRFDHVYNGSSWVSKGLLVEEQRTNLAFYSSDYTNGWTRRGMTQVAGQSSPDGGTSATLSYPSGSQAYCDMYRVLGVAATIGQAYTLSFIVKASGKNFVYISDINASNVSYFNLSTGAVSFTFSGHNPSIVSLGGGWYRCSNTTTAVGTTGHCYMGISDASGSTAATVNGTDGVMVFAAQSELGSFATSYIPTTSASVTRSADVCQITGGDFSGFWNASEGSFAAEYDRLFSASSITNASTVFQAFIDGSNNDRYALFHNSSGTVGERFNVTVGNAEYANLDSGVSISQTSGRSSTAYKVNDFALSVNGGAIVSDTSGPIVSSANKLNIGQMYGSNWLNGHIARLRYYAIRLPNRLLIAKST